MKKRQKFEVLAFCIALIFVLQLLPLESAFAATGIGTGVTKDLTGTNYLNIHGTTGTNPTSIIIKDGTTTLSPDASGNYTDVPTGATLAFSLGFDLSNGDSGDETIYEYDGTECFTYQLPIGVTFNATSGTVPNSGSPTIANWTIDATGLLTVNFTSAIANKSNIWGYVKMNGTFDSMASGGQNTKIELGSQTITITRNPTDPTPPAGQINLDKNGAYDPSTGLITWTVTVTPDSTTDLGGYKIVDTYNATQTYVPNSFEVATVAIPDTSLNNGASPITSPITYTFPTGTTGTQVITYQTAPVTGFNNITQFKNTAVLKDVSDTTVKSADKTLTLAGIIKKEGTNIQPDGNGNIDWTVTVNLPKASDGGSYFLPNSKIIDDMDSKLGLITSEPIQISFDGGTNFTSVSSGSGAGEYSVDASNVLTYIFPADKPYTGTTTVFKYSTKVTNWNTDMMNNGAITFTNDASFTWSTNPGGGGSGSAVSIGAATVTKTASSGGLVSKSLAGGWASQSQYDVTNEKSGDFIKWKIVVNGNKVALNSASIKDTVQSGHDLILSSTYPMTVEKNSDAAVTYDSLKTDANGTLSAFSSSSFTFDFPTAITDTYTIEYYTELNDTGRSAMYQGTNNVSASKTFQNDVQLSYTGGTASSSATKTYTLEMLNKSVATGYNIADHTVKWNLVVNRNMLPMTGSSVTDTLPAGMVFVIDGITHPLTIAAEDSTKATATDSLTGAGTISGVNTLLDNTQLTGANGGNSFTLTFPTPTSSEFTITYWTKVTDDTLQNTSLWTNKQLTFTNNVALVTGKGTVTASCDVIAKNPVISKTSDYNASNPYEIINWTSVINPAQVALNTGTVTDILNSNLELVDGSVYLYPATIASNGSATQGTPAVSLTKNGTADAANAAYTYSSKTLTVSLPTATSNAYILRFQTTILDDTITTAFTNTISLSTTGSTSGSGISSQVTVHEITAIGGVYSNSFTVKKTDGKGINLPGATFQLLNKNGNPVKRLNVGTGTLENIIVKTNSSGNAVFTGLPSWVFNVKEIDPPAGYLIDNTAIIPVNGGAPISGNTTIVNATDTLGIATVEIYKTGAGSVNLDGGEFTLAGTADYTGAAIIPRTTAAISGKVTFANVPIGNYTITETAAPTGHQLNATPITVTVGYTDSTKTGVTVSYSPLDKTIVNVPVPASTTQVSFTKTDLNGTAIDGSVLGGTFVLTGTDYNHSSVNKTATLASDGTVSFSNVTISNGNYQICETVTPTGYLNPNATPSVTPVLDVTVAYNSGKTGLDVSITKHGGGAADTGGNGKIIFKNAPATGTVFFSKSSSADPTAVINGGNFKISGTTVANLPYEAYSSAVGGSVTFNNVPVEKVGTSYTITEVTAPPGYLLTTTQLTAKVEYLDATNTAVSVTNPATGLKNTPAPFLANTKVSVLKTDENGTKLAGASFALYNSSGNVVATSVSGNDGIALFSNIPTDNSYTIKETAAPTGYELSSQVLSFTLKDTTPLSFTVIDKKILQKSGSINISKTDASGIPLAGAEFTLYDSIGNSFGSAVTKADGTAQFTNVPVGKYTLKETAAPAGYIISGSGVNATVKGGDSLSFSFKNEKSSAPSTPDKDTGKLQIAKVDENHQPLAGAEFTLYDKNGNAIGKAVSGSDGIVVFAGLAPGDYSVQETAAPDGYTLFTDSLPFQIQTAGSVKSFTLKDTNVSDDKGVAGWSDNNDLSGNQPTKLPQTGGIPASLYLLLAGAGLLLAGLITGKTRKIREKHSSETK